MLTPWGRLLDYFESGDPILVDQKLEHCYSLNVIDWGFGERLRKI